MKYRIDLARKVAKHKIDQFFLAEKGFESQNSSAEIGQSINKGENKYEG